MSEDEKKAIDMLEKYITEHKFYNIKQSDALEDNIKILLDLYQQEREKNKELTEIKQQKLSKYLHENLWICKDLSENYIHKQKIREKIEELEGQEDWYIENKSLDDLYGRIDELKELLKEE